MKGLELPALLFAFMFMVGITFILAGLVVWVINAAPTSKTYSMVVTGIHEPIKHQLVLLAYLEATYSDQNVPMKELIEAMTLQNITTDSTSIWLDGNPIELEDVTSASSSIFSQWLGNMPYVLVLKLDTVDKIIAGSTSSFTRLSKVSIKKVSVPVWTPIQNGELELYVGE